jgi:hypothetical protein
VRRFFDPIGAGSFRPSELRRLLHNLGRRLPQRRVVELVSSATEADAERRASGRVVYARTGLPGARVLQGGGAEAAP